MSSAARRPTVWLTGPADAEAWTAFAREHPKATLYHSLAWRDFIEAVFGHEPLYLACGQSGRLRGILPLFKVRFPFLGCKLISLPYDIGSGGPLAEDQGSESKLIAHAMAHTRANDCRYLELRCDARCRAAERLHLDCRRPVLLSEMTLEDEDEVWRRVRKDHRKAMRKAGSRGVRVRQAHSLDDYLAFYRIYLRVFRDFGTPAYAPKYFRALWDRLHPEGQCILILAEVDGNLVGGLLLFAWGSKLVSKFAVCLPEAVPLHAYSALYGEAIRVGLELGYRVLSWGTSSPDQKGLIEYKERWGATSRLVNVYSMAIQSRPPPLEAYYDSRSLKRRLWKRLPLFAAKMLGGYVNQWFC